MDIKSFIEFALMWLCWGGVVANLLTLIGVKYHCPSDNVLVRIVAVVMIMITALPVTITALFVLAFRKS